MGKRNRGRSGAKKAAQKLKQSKVTQIKNASKGVKAGAKFVKGAGQFVKGAAGAVTSAVGGAVKGAVIGTSKLAVPLITGAYLGEAYKNSDRAPAVSGRGAGRATFRDSNNNNRPNLQKGVREADRASSGSNGGRGENRSGVTPIDGSYRTAVEQGPDGDVTPSSGNAGGAQSVDPDGSGYIAPTGGSGGTDERTNTSGIVQRGLTLGGINSLYSSLSSADRKGGAVMAAGDLPSANSFFSEALPTTDAGKAQGHEGPRVNYSWDTESETDVFDENKGGLVPPSTPGTTGNNPDNPQDGTSAKPSVADKVRAIRIGRQSGFDDDDDSLMPSPGGDSDYDYPDDDSLVSPMYSNKDRNAARAAFLDPNNKGYSAIRARDRAVGAFDQNGVGGMNIDGKFYQFKDGMSRDARFELSGGGINSKDDAQAFLNKYLKEFNNSTPTEAPTQTETESPTTTQQTDTTKPLVVPTDQIPGPNASQAEKDEYFRALDAGELTR